MPSTFVHLHNHSDFSILDAATRIDAMVKRAVDLGMPAIALTDHGYMFGIPNFDLACRKYNDAQKDFNQWKHDVECFQKGWELEEPEPDAPDAALHDRVHAQWESDVAIWERTGDLDAVKANKPSPLIKPIFGCEAYFITDDTIEKGTRQRRYHLILLAKNETGYVNLMKMMSKAANEMFYYKPRTTLDMLKEYHEGIICQSACVQGIIPQNILDGNFDEAERWARTFQDIFGEDFYIEIQDHGLTFRNGFTDRTLDEQLVKLARKLGIKVVATNDIHYLTREDAPTQDILSCIGTASRLDEPNRKHMEGTEFYLKTEEEMRELFSWCPEACDNTLEIADKCNYELDWTHMYLPKFPGLEEGETSEERFRKECEEGLAKRYGDNWRELTIGGVNVLERFEYEYDVICTKGFADYFLIVQEYVRWAKENGIGVGPGRGSAAGAIVAYAMDITTFDPLENGLMFERFLSVERSEMPDIDMDFDDERRLEVVQHVRELYGADRVSHVITYSTIKAKQAINDANRVLGYPGVHGPEALQDDLQRPKGQAQVRAQQGRARRTSTRRTSSTPTTRMTTRIASSTRRSPSRASPAARACMPAPSSSPPRPSTTTCPPSSTPRAASRSPSTRATRWPTWACSRWTSWACARSRSSPRPCATSAPTTPRRKIARRPRRRSARHQAGPPASTSTWTRFPSTTPRSSSSWAAATPRACSRSSRRA